MFGFLKKEIQELEKGPSISSKGLDRTQISIDNIEGKTLPDNGKKNIVIMDDDSFMAFSFERDIKSLNNIIQTDEIKEIMYYINIRYGSVVLNKIQEFIKQFDSSNYNIIQFTGNKCGFELIKTIDDTKNVIDYAILDVVLGGLVIDKNDVFVSVDGLDVAKKILDRFESKVNILISTGCTMKDSKEDYKFKNTIGDVSNVNIYIKGLDISARLGDILVLLSGVEIDKGFK